jgi:hypothetical protein
MMSVNRQFLVSGALVVASTAAAAMGVRRGDVDEVRHLEREHTRHIEWFGVLKPVNGAKVAGNAGMVAGERDGTTEVSLVLSGVTNARVYGWAVHRGHCDQPGARTLGAATQYTAAKGSTSGAAAVTVTLPVALPDSGTFHVRVRSGPQGTASAVACGNLYLED